MGVVPVDLGAPEGACPGEPVRSFVTMQEGIPQGGMEGSLKGRDPSGGDYWSRGSGATGPGVPRRWTKYGSGVEARLERFTFRRHITPYGDA